MMIFNEYKLFKIPLMQGLLSDYWQNQVRDEELMRTKDLVRPLNKSGKIKEKIWQNTIREAQPIRKISWRSPNESEKTNVELICETIHRFGEQYEDGTASIAFEELLQVSLEGDGNLESLRKRYRLGY